jgi:AcrR family transcriptional regulator
VPRPRSLTPPTIAAAALAVTDRAGVACLSMRAVADELGVGTMSLYRYVSGRDELEALLVDAVLAGVDLTVPPRSPWQARLTTLVERVRAAVADHPAVAPLLLARRQSSAASLAWAEAMLTALDDGGFRGAERALAFRAALSYLFGAIQVEHLGALGGPGTAAIAALPADTYPLLADTAGHARRIAPAEEFSRGLAVLLRGLESARRARRRAP